MGLAEILPNGESSENLDQLSCVLLLSFITKQIFDNRFCLSQLQDRLAQRVLPIGWTARTLWTTLRTPGLPSGKLPSRSESGTSLTKNLTSERRSAREGLVQVRSTWVTPLCCFLLLQRLRKVAPECSSPFLRLNPSISRAELGIIRILKGLKVI